MWWMAIAKGAKEKGAAGKKALNAKSSVKKHTYEPDQSLALSMSRPKPVVDVDFSDEERKKKRLKASY